MPTDLASAATRGHNQMMAGGGDSMMMMAASPDDPEYAGGEMKMTAAEKKAARDPQADLRAQVREKLKGLPKEERQSKAKILRNGNPAQKRALLLELGIEPPAGLRPAGRHV